MNSSLNTASESDMFPLNAPDIKISVNQAFGIESDLEVPAFSEGNQHVPTLDEAYQFDRETTLAILAGFAYITVLCSKQLGVFPQQSVP